MKRLFSVLIVLGLVTIPMTADAVVWKTIKLYPNTGSAVDTFALASGDTSFSRNYDLTQYGQLAEGVRGGYFDPNDDDEMHTIPAIIQASFSAGSASVDTIAGYIEWSHDGTYWFAAPEVTTILAKSSTATTPATGAAGGYLVTLRAREARLLCGARYVRVGVKEIDSIAGATKNLRLWLSLPFKD